MSKIALVTDSTASIPKDLSDKYNIIVAPQILLWGNETFEDGVNITPGEFYTRIKKASVMPSTTQVTVAKFLEIYQQLLDQDYQIVSILVSSKLSGTVNSAVQAKSMLPAGAPIEIIDSNSTAMAMGFHLISVSRAIKQGASLAECVELAHKASLHTGVFFAVDTLEFLHRGGRTPVRLSSLHANAPEDAKFVLEEAGAKLNPIETVYSEVSPVVGVHAGPGVVGLVYMAGM